MSKHTPGPWKYGQDGYRLGSGVIYATQEFGHPLEICVTHEWGEKDIANARMIAAAPELLEALREFAGCAYPVATSIDPRGHAWSEAYLDAALARARAAVAKALGN